MQAQAAFKQQAYAGAIGLLVTQPAGRRRYRATNIVFGLARAQFERGEFFLAAATFDALPKTYPESSLRLRAVVEGNVWRWWKLSEWEQAAVVLEEKDGVFQRARLLGSR